MTQRLYDTALSPQLNDLVDRNSFNEVLTNYHKLFDLSLRVFDDKGNLISEASKSYPACQAFGKSETGRKRCIATRLKIKKTMPEEKRLLSIECLSGLRYTAAPINFQGNLIGKLVLGPYKPEDAHTSPSSDADLDLTETRAALKPMRTIPTSLVRKIAASMLAVLDAVLFSAHKALLTSEMHIASVRDSFETIKKKNLELEAMNERMKEFERLKSSFLSTISHELRTPLTSIIGYSDLLAEGIAGDLDDEQLQFVDTIKNKGEELLKLISSILDFSQIETGHLKLSVVEIAPKELVENTLSHATDSAEKRGIKLVCTIDEELEQISIDVEKIQTALAHLVDNAVKFSPPGSIVRVSAEIAESDKSDEDDEFGFVLMSAPRRLVITVQDFGEGIAPENQVRIFSPFTQLDDSTTREHGGAGLGLALVKQFVEAHGGSVSVSSTLNEGSEFLITLPISAAQ